MTIATFVCEIIFINLCGVEERNERVNGINQVHDTFATKNDWIKQYKHKVWYLVKQFDAFWISFAPRGKNHFVDSLSIYASLCSPHPSLSHGRYTVEILTRPSILDNVKYWQVFEYDEEIWRFLWGEEGFEDSCIEDKKSQDDLLMNQSTYDEGIIHLRTDKIPKGLVILESHSIWMMCVI